MRREALCQRDLAHMSPERGDARRIDSHRVEMAAGVTLHVRKREGRNTHHVVEAVFKATARCIRDAVRVEGTAVPSTKGRL